VSNVPPLRCLFRGKWSSKFLVSHRIDVSEFAELYQAFDKRQGGLMKVFVQTRHR
jgi:threonine dehydrogenase-like Zn-dependent dehydrogenase